LVPERDQIGRSAPDTRRDQRVAGPGGALAALLVRLGQNPDLLEAYHEASFARMGITRRLMAPEWRCQQLPSMSTPDRGRDARTIGACRVRVH